MTSNDHSVLNEFYKLKYALFCKMKYLSQQKYHDKFKNIDTHTHLEEGEVLNA